MCRIEKFEIFSILQVLVRLEQDQKVTEDARRRSEQDLAAHKFEVHVLQVVSPPSYDHCDFGRLF